MLRLKRERKTREILLFTLFPFFVGQTLTHGGRRTARRRSVQSREREKQTKLAKIFFSYLSSLKQTISIQNSLVHFAFLICRRSLAATATQTRKKNKHIFAYINSSIRYFVFILTKKNRKREKNEIEAYLYMYMNCGYL